ncbi:MAG: hypothetical protein L0H29_07075, partial [Sinobacteraceae bacterium]|nr:hypothetical protein [Nevskiaceae bacterium]
MARPAGMLTEAGQKRRRQREAEQRRLEKQLYEHIKCIAPDLHAGIAGAELTPRQLVEILDSMPSVAKVSEAKRMRRRLRAILDDLRKTTGGEVAMPAMEVMIHRPKSPFVGTTMADVAELNRTIEYFIRDISDEPIVDDTLTVARISFAATALGGLLIPALTKALPETLQNGFFAKDGVYWVDFPLPAENGKVLTRRWFLDPVSTCLIAAALRRPVTWPKPYVPRKALQTLLKRLKVADGSPFYRMDDFRRVSEARLRLALPGVLVDFLSSTRRGTSLSARGWWRVLADYHLAPDETDAFPDR